MMEENKRENTVVLNEEEIKEEPMVEIQKEEEFQEKSYLYYEDMLEGEYKQVYDKIQTYAMINANSFTELELNDMLMELIDMLNEAQIKNKPVEKMVGQDVEQFCKNYFEEEKSWLNAVKRIPKLLYSMCWIAFVFGILDLVTYEGDGVAIYQFETDLTPYLGGAIVGLLAASIATMIGKKLLFRWKSFGTTHYLIIDIVFTVLGIVCAVVFLPDVTIGISIISTIIISGLYILFYKGIQFYDRYKKYGSIKKPEEEKMLGFKAAWDAGWQSGKESTRYEDSVLGIQEKIFDKKNTRRKKKGKPELSEEEFTEKFRKDVILSRKINQYYPVFIALIALIAFFSELDNDLTEALIFGGIMAVVQTAIMIGVSKIITSVDDEREELLRICDKEGITIIELARRTKQAKEEAEDAELEENYLENEWEEKL